MTSSRTYELPKMETVEKLQCEYQLRCILVIGQLYTKACAGHVFPPRFCILRLPKSYSEGITRCFLTCVPRFCSAVLFGLGCTGRHVPIRRVRRLVRFETDAVHAKEFVSSALGGFPALIDVTLEELETGLEAGEFTSVDLVNV